VTERFRTVHRTRSVAPVPASGEGPAQTAPVARQTPNGCIVQVWFDVDSEIMQRNHTRPHFHMIETELPDFATFALLVEGDRLIGGATLWTRKGAQGEQIIIDRQPIAFRGSAVMRCQLPRWRFVEGEEA
jgi:hypothetical protein